MGGKSTARRGQAVQGEARRTAIAVRERRLSDLTAAQHGVITRAQLLDAGLGNRTIERRVERGQLRRLHQGVYGLGGNALSRRGQWLAPVLACGKGALLSHRSAAALWGLVRYRSSPIDVTSPDGRGRPGIAVHEGGIDREDRTEVDRIPITTVARTLFDFAEVVDLKDLERAFEEADRLRLLEMPALEAVCDRGHGRRALRPVRRLIEQARAPVMTRTPLEDRVVELCREHRLPLPLTNVHVLDHEVDAYWPGARLIVEADSWQFHGHRAAFERDRARDSARQAAGYRVVRLTHRRIEREPAAVAAELRHLLSMEDGRAGT